VPEAPGVYLFYGEAGAPLYVGMSRAMRSRVLQHFYSSAPWTREVRRIEWQRTTGELGALLREAKLVKELAPLHNRQLRKAEKVCGLAFDGRRLRLAGGEEIDADTLGCLYGVYRSRRAALAALRNLADEHGLCLRTLGFEPFAGGACFRHQVGRCAGVCAGKENVHAHHARLLAALAPLKTADWPHAGAVGIVEADAEREATDVHVVDRWCHLGTAHDDAELAELSEQFSNGRRAPAFDYDHYRILSRHLGKRGVRVVPLSH